MTKTRRWLFDYEAKSLGLDIKPNEENRKNARYRIKDKDWENIKLQRETPRERDFVETIRKLDKNGELVSSVEKLQSEPIGIPENFELVKISTSTTTGQQWLQHLPKKENTTLSKIDFDKIISKYAKPFKINPIKIKSGSFEFDRLVYSDVHIGMETNQNGFSLYGGVWNEEEIISRLDFMISYVLENKKSNVLIIDDLGDFMDGWDGETVRKGHSLPQNMDNEKAFDVGFEFKIKLIDGLAPFYSRIICNNICNDNHSGSFSYVVNKPFKRFIETRYDNVIVNNIRKFIDHYVYGKNCFIISHGKDGKNLKFGFKPILDSKQIEKISNYIKEHKLHDYIIEFSKGDSHQKIFDESTSDEFDYYNYPAFSPSSEWVQTNFKKGFSGFEFFNFKNNGQKLHVPFKFQWNVGREQTTIDYSISK